MAEETQTMGIIDKIKFVLGIKRAVEQVQAGPKTSFLTGEFWAKVAAAACTLWAGFHNFIPHPIDVYITVALALVVSVERLWLKHKHLETLVDLSQAPAFRQDQLASALQDLVAKFPKLSFAVAPVEKAAADVVAKASEPVPSAIPAISVTSSVTALPPA